MGYILHADVCPSRASSLMAAYDIDIIHLNPSYWMFMLFLTILAIINSAMTNDLEYTSL